MVFLISWNVAGLSTTANRIHDLYGSSNGDKSNTEGEGTHKKKAASGTKTNKNQCSSALAYYFERHGNPDIVCLQEHKIPKAQLSNRSEPRGCAHVEGYESFWSCCTDDKSKGMNGVCTYAKKGTVVSANAAPFDVTSLNEQGRCVMTDHGQFVVFNVYVPATGGRPMAEKMRFLNSLRRAMQEQRHVHNKAVMLVGDLNISHGKLDVYWKHLSLNVNKVLEQVGTAECDTTITSLPKWKAELAKAWPTILKTMKTKKAVPKQTSNSLTGATYDRYRLCVTMENPERTIYLGKHESDPDYCYYGYDFDHPCHYTDPETNEILLAHGENMIMLSVLQELMGKLCKMEWNEKTLREIADSEDAIRSDMPHRQWLTCLLEEDDMVDVFRHFYPTAKARFTCWHQFTNTRYSNNGVRIDYTIVDRSLLPFVQLGGNLRTGEILDLSSPSSNSSATTSQVKNEVDPLTEEAALAAATAKGRFQPVSFEGGGITEASMETLNTQFGPRHTGMIYTPPSFSDHIAVSLLLADDGAHGSASGASSWRADSWGKLALNEKDTSTKKAQPHKAQTSISSFFRNGSNGEAKKPLAAASSKAKLPQKRPAANTVKSFFQPKPTSFENSQNNNNSDNNNNRKVKPKPTSLPSKQKKPAPHSILSHFTRK